MSGEAVVSPLFSAVELSEVTSPSNEDDGHQSGEMDNNNIDRSRRDGYRTVCNNADVTMHPESYQYTFLKPLLLWLYPLVAIAQKGHITEDDIWTTPPDVDVESSSAKLRMAYNHVTTHMMMFKPDGHVDAAKGVRQSVGHRVKAVIVRAMPPFGWAIWVAFNDVIFTSGFYHLCFAVLQLTLPFMIGELLSYISTGDGGVGYGFGLVIALGLVSCASSYCIISTFYQMRRGALQMKAATMMNVYRQALQLTTASRQKCSVGQTTNLMSIDADKLAIGLQFVHFLWHGPCAVIAVMIILSFEVGAVASVAGLSFLFFLMPLQRYIAKKIGRLRRLMVNKTDQRVKLTNEILQVIRAIKYYHWEESMYSRIQAVRSLEMDKLFTYLVVNGLLREMMFLSVPLAAFFIFSIYVFVQGRYMSVIQVFRVIAYLNTLRFPTHLFSQALKYLSDGSVSVHRLDDFFALPTLSLAIENDSNDNIMQADRSVGYHHIVHGARPGHGRKRADSFTGGSVSIANATFSWLDVNRTDDVAESGSLPSNVYNPITPGSDGEDFELRGVNLKLMDGELVAVIGAVGAGKSSLVSSLLGEMACREGSCVIAGNIAYCAQTPWIQNMTLRDNILFGQTFEVENKSPATTHTGNAMKNGRYYDALYNAALLPDLAILPLGDLTEIGERGINLSGGQKARVSLARALMASPRSDIILLDDPFSAVDGHTGETMFYNGVVDGLNGKLRIVVMNSHMHLINNFDKVIMMDNGKIVAMDKPDVLASSEKHGKLFHKMTGGDHGEVVDGNLNPDKKYELTANRGSDRQKAVQSYIFPLPQTVCEPPNASIKQTIGVTDPTGKLVVREDRAKGNIPISVYINYFSACLWNVKSSTNGMGVSAASMLNSTGFAIGMILCGLLVILFGAAQIARIAVDLLLVRWAQKQSAQSFKVYVLVLVSLCLLILMRMMSLNSQSVRSSKNIHSYVLQRVMAAPVPTFFDTHTVGEVLNRFAKDLEIVDTSIPEFFLQFLTNWFQISSIFILCVWSTPYFLAFMAPLAYAFYKVYVNFACVSRDLKRLESVSRTPVYSSFSETLNGLDTIRAYGDSDRFIQSHLSRMNRLQKVSFHSQMVMSWVTARLELMVSMVMFAVALCAVAVRSSVSEVGVGMALVYTLQLTALFQRCVQLTIDLQGYFTSAERLLSYATIPQEESQRNGDSILTQPSHFEHWPDRGAIEFKNVTMRYRENDLVLRGLTFKINGGSRVGVCGRTGAGKSSIMLALFRIVEIEGGAIYIDGRETGSIPLETLRSRLAIIPQDPVLFSGTIRFQLDPFEEYSDVEIWEALDQVYMSETVKAMPGGLNASIAENGDNLSQGQRQLLCISRALLRRNKILIMDEATSAVDPHTDGSIQKLLRSSVLASGCTVLTIAHRLQTIADYDFVLVMDKGVVAEYGPPSELLEDEESLFHRMYNSKSISD